MKYTTHIEDDDGQRHEVVVTYSWTKPYPATYSSPAEGGCEIIDITCPIRLSRGQMLAIEAECAEYAAEGSRSNDGLAGRKYGK